MASSVAPKMLVRLHVQFCQHCSQFWLLAFKMVQRLWLRLDYRHKRCFFLAQSLSDLMQKLLDNYQKWHSFLLASACCSQEHGGSCIKLQDHTDQTILYSPALRILCFCQSLVLQIVKKTNQTNNKTQTITTKNKTTQTKTRKIHTKFVQHNLKLSPNLQPQSFLLCFQKECNKLCLHSINTLSDKYKHLT